MKKYLIAVASLIGLLLLAWLLRNQLTLANFGMIYILFVVVIAIRLGTIAAMATALICFLSIKTSASNLQTGDPCRSSV